MLGAGVFLEFVEADGAARVHVLDALADAFEHPGIFGHLAKLLVAAASWTTNSALPLMVSTTGSPVRFNCSINSDVFFLKSVSDWMSRLMSSVGPPGGIFKALNSILTSPEAVAKPEYASMVASGPDRRYYPGTEEAHTNPTHQRGECLRALAHIELVCARMRNFLAGVIDE